MDILERIEERIHIIKEKASFADTCCDKPEDRMYHAEDSTWWQRVGNNWRQADPPPGWEKKKE